MNEPWYKDGLCFECTRCGRCCRGEPGVVIVSDDDIAAMARRLKMGEAAFRKRFLRKLENGALSLKEEENFDCVFYRPGTGCSIYGDRPRQCRTWPFWGKIVESRRNWEWTARQCPGMNRGKRHPAPEIEETARDDGTLGGWD